MPERRTRTRPIRIAVQVGQQHADFAVLRDAALRAEDAGADIVFNWDHFFPYTGDPEGKSFECLTMLASLAEATERVELGALVTCVAYRNPHLLADMARTVDHISGGRFILGLGAGWYERDYQEYGYDFPPITERLRRLAHDVPIIRDRLGRLNPPPMRRMPILIGGSGERVTLRIVAEHADIWHSYGSAVELRRKTSVLEGWCQRVGRDPDQIERSTAIYQGYSSGLASDLLDARVSLVVFEHSGPDFNFSELPAWIRWRDEVNAA